MPSGGSGLKVAKQINVNVSGNSPRETTLRRIQTIPYLVAHDDPWIEELLVFAYSRESGGSNELGLTTEHRRIWEAIRS